jgi:hypothetical protein
MHLSPGDVDLTTSQTRIHLDAARGLSKDVEPENSSDPRLFGLGPWLT